MGSRQPSRVLGTPLLTGAGGAARYTQKELVGAMRTLLDANEKLFSSGGEPRAVIADALVAICAKG